MFRKVATSSSAQFRSLTAIGRNESRQVASTRAKEASVTTENNSEATGGRKVASAESEKVGVAIGSEKVRVYASRSKEAGLVTRNQILALPSTPLCSPSYPRGPYSFKNREYFIITYETDAQLLRKVIPQPLSPAPPGNLVLYEWIRMPDSTGFGSYQESGTVVPCVTPSGESVNFTLQMFLDCEPPIAAGREIWGFPKKYAHPEMGVYRDTIYGKLSYADQEVATGTMAYKYQSIPKYQALRSLLKTSVNLKMIPDVNFQMKIAQLIKYNLIVEDFKFAYEGPARLNLHPHINAPAAHLPVHKVISGKHLLADVILPYGSVMHDYLDPNVSQPVENDNGCMTRSEIIGSRRAMPHLGPSYSLKESHMQNRQYFVIKYETTKDAIRRLIPDTLFPNEHNIAYIQWVHTTSTGLGDYNKLDILVPVTDKYGQEYLFGVMSFLNCSAPITGGREIYGQPQKFGNPSFSVQRDTMIGTLDYCGIRVANGTMRYHTKKMELGEAEQFLSIPHLNLKFIPDAKGNVEIAQLVKLQHEKVRVQSAYESPVRLQLFDHANAPVADLPVVKEICGFSIVGDIVLPEAQVIHDYLKQ